METRELRIWNWVLLDNPNHRPNDTGEIHKVCGISENSVHLIKVNNNPYQDSYGQFLKYIKPIPLTEEILLKCGIDYGYEIIIKIGRKKIVFNWLSKIVSTGYRSGWYCKKYKNIKHLHQLQNLYFALTGEELEVNL